MVNLFAICRPEGELVVKRVQLAQPVQAKVGQIFEKQAQAFLQSVSEEVEFSGGWKPDDDELLTMDVPSDGAAIINALSANAISLPVIDAHNFSEEGIKGLFVIEGTGATQRVLIQNFFAQQLLTRGRTFFLSGDSFKELTDTAFTLDSSISAIMEGGKVKFKSFQRLRSIFDLKDLYRVATDQQVEDFCQHASLAVADVAAFKVAADQGIRKLITAIDKADVLNKHEVSVIADKAAGLGITINTHNGKLVMPASRGEIKILLRFLDDGVFRSELNSSRYMTNSKRKIL